MRHTPERHRDAAGRTVKDIRRKTNCQLLFCRKIVRQSV
jgi:hypothetical protein